MVSRRVVTQSHSQRTYADQVREEPVSPRSSSRLTEKLSPCLGGPLSKVEINIAEFMTIHTKTVIQPYFCEIENPTSWKRRMFFRRLFRTFIVWKKNRCLHHWTLITSTLRHSSQVRLHSWLDLLCAVYTWKFLQIVIMFNWTLKFARCRATIHETGKREQLPKTRNGL